MQKRVVSASIKGLSVFQIYLLVTMTFAFAFLLGQEINTVSAVSVGEQYKDDSGRVLTVTEVTSSKVFYSASTPQSTGSGEYDLETFNSRFPNPQKITTSAPAVLSSPARSGSLLKNAPAAGRSGAITEPSLFDKTADPIKIPGTDVKVPFTDRIGVNVLAKNVGHALIWAAVANMAARLVGANSQQAGAISNAIGVGTFVGKTVAAFGKGGALYTKGGTIGNFLGGLNPFLAGAAVAVIIFVFTYKKTKQEVVTFQCLPWEPPIGGNKCEQCNSDPLKPCSEYRCKALGQACELLNKNTANPQCAWVSKSDTQSPTIVEWNEVLRPTNLQYTPNNALRPGARGVKIVSPENAGCLPAFTALQFGITTNEPAQCKVDYNRSVNFDSMQFYFGGSTFYEYNHTQALRLPDPNNIDNDLSPLLQNDGTFALFVRCRDANGNANEDEYSINFCVNKGPDTTAPIIEGSSLESDSPIRAGADNTTIEIYTNEPASCKWSINDKAYKDMENPMACATDATQINANLQFTCSGLLNGIRNLQTNDFYFRCEDQPTSPENERNAMGQSYKLTLRGTEPLSLLRAGPNSTTITSSASNVIVDLTAETDDGAENGKAVCYFSPTGVAGSFVEYYETDAIQHKQSLSLTAGTYRYYTRCVDLGGNAVSTDVNFTVAVDKNMPVVTRVYKRGTDALQMITSEPAECYYSKTSCNFVTNEGLKFNNPSPDQTKVHIAAWKDNSPYYVKCRDAYGNEPSPNSCSIIVSGVDLSVKAVA